MTSNAVPLTWGEQSDTLVSGLQNSSTGLRDYKHSDAYTTAEEVVGVESLRNLPEGGYRLLRPLQLTIYRARDYYWVAPAGFVLHGIGATIEEAVEDYGYALLDYYEELCSQRELLAPHLLEHLEYLETIIARE